MVKQFLKQTALRTIKNPIVQKVSKCINNKKYIFLMYHGITKDGTCDGDGLQITESAFHEQMKYLYKNYNVVSLRDILNDTVNETISGPNIVITFDDGYANNYKIAYPILEEYGLPATVFLVTGRLGSEKLFWYDKLFNAIPGHIPADKKERIIESFKNIHPHRVDNAVDEYILKQQYNVPNEAHELYRVLTWDEIHRMSQSGLITFGSHTHQHELLTQMREDEVRTTLQTSYNIIQRVPDSINVFCYPNGWYNQNHIDMMKDIGYDLAVKAVSKGKMWARNMYDYEIPRWGIGRDVDIQEFSSIVSGTMHALHSVANRT